MPITWKNINVPTLNSTGMNQGANLLSKGVDQLAQVAKDYNTGLTDQATDDLLGRIAATGDMGAYNALRQEIAAGGVGNADASKVWQMLNARDNDIRADMTGQLNLGKLQRTEAQTLATKPLLDQVAQLTDVNSVDSFVKSLSGMNNDNVLFSDVTAAAEERRNALTGNTLDDNKVVRDGINTNTAVTEANNTQAITGFTPKLEELVGNAPSLSEAVVALNKDLVGKPVEVQEQVRSNFENMWTARTGLTPNETLEFDRALEDVGTQEFENGVTFNAKKTELDTQEVKLQNQLSSIPESMRPGVEAMTPGELSQMVVNDFNLDDDRWWQWGDTTKEDVPGMLSKLENYARDNVAAFAPDKDGNLPEIPTAVLLETLRQAGLNDFDDGKGEIDDSDVKKALTSALKVWNSNQALYSDYLAKSNALKSERARLAGGLKQATRGIEDQVNTAADAKRLLR